MKKKMLLLLLLIMTFLFNCKVVYAIDDSNIGENNITQIKIKSSSNYLKFGTTIHLSVVAIPTNENYTDVIWESSNTNIATVNSNGGISSSRYTGIVTITATSTINPNLKDSIVLYSGQYSVETGKEIVLGENWFTGHSEANWIVEDESLFEIMDQTTKKRGTVYEHWLSLKAIKSGYTKVSMQTITGDYIIDYHVYVYNPIKKISNNEAKIEIEKNNIKSLKIIISPNNVTEELNKLLYFSEDNSIASIDQDGSIYALKNGSTNIIIYSQYSDATLIVPVTVVTSAESIEVDNDELTLTDDNNTHQIEYTLTPSDTSNKNVTFESNNESIVTVSDTGLITAIGNGEAIITITSGDKKTSKDIKVTATGIRKSITNLEYTGIDNYEYDGTAKIPNVTIHDGNYELIKNEDYLISYDNNIEIGTATVLIEGIGNYKETKELSFKIEEPKILSIESSSDIIDFGEQFVNYSNNIEKSIIITNNGDYPVKLSISNPVSSGPFVSISFNNNYVLNPNELYIVRLAAKAGGTLSDVPGIYTGNYVITATMLDDSKSFDLTLPARINIKKLPQSVSYTTHVENIGWQKYVKDGAMAGTSGRAFRLEGIKIKVDNPDYSGDIEYRTHVENIGWQYYVKNGEMAGTSGRAYRLEAIQIRLKGEIAVHYDVYYRVHAENFGWMNWAKNDEMSGTAGYAYRLEGIEIVLVEKGQEPPTRTNTNYKYSFRDKNADPQNTLIKYTTHVQNIGWQSYVYDGAMAGTSGKAYRLEGIKINLTNKAYSGDIEYRTHVQYLGWQDYVKNGEMAGTSGRAYRLEAIQIRLTGEMAEHYDVYYRVHAENIGWMNWAKNDEMSGTAGYAYRLEGIEIVLVEKGQSPPSRANMNNSNSFIQR